MSLGQALDQFFTDLGNLIKKDVTADLLPAIAADLQDVVTNPADYLNPLTQPLKTMKLIGDLQGALPGFEKDLLKDGAQLILSYINNVQQPAAKLIVNAALKKAA